MMPIPKSFKDSIINEYARKGGASLVSINHEGVILSDESGASNGPVSEPVPLGVSD